MSICKVKLYRTRPKKQTDKEKLKGKNNYWVTIRQRIFDSSYRAKYHSFKFPPARVDKPH